MIIFDSTEPSLSKPPTGTHCHETNLTREEMNQRIGKKRYNMQTANMVKFPQLNCLDDLAAWIARVEEDLMDVIPRSQWADATILYLASYEPLNMLMKQKRARRMEAGGSDIWIWEDFQKSLSQELEKRDSRTGIQSFHEDHPIAANVATAGLVTAGSLILAPAIVVLGLNAVGFTASGVAGGSVAAGLQSAAYGGMTTGLFSACQSIGATWVVGSGSIISGIGSLAAGASILGSSSRKNKTSDDSDSESDSEESDLAEGSRSISPPPYS